MTSARWESDLSLAHRMADVAAAIALEHFGPRVATRRKPDGSPVTIADIEVDRVLGAILREERPDDAVLSEESGASGHDPATSRRWIIDPIDGTTAYAHGQAGWGTFIALVEAGDIVLGLINHPVDRRRYWATLGDGTRLAPTQDGLVVGPDRTLTLSSVSKLADARFTAWPPRPSPALIALQAAAGWVEPTFDFLADLLEGRIDLLLSQGGDIWDHAAGVILVEEAGGRFRDPQGDRRLDLRGGIYMTAALDTEVGALLNRW